MRSLLVPIRHVLVFTVLMAAAFALPARAASPDKLERFLQVTGFDVALDSIRLSADSAPELLGVDFEAFGSEWSRLVEEVFAQDILRNMALEILGNTLEDDLLDHAMDFYGSDLGARLVAVENDSHMVNDDGAKAESGEQILAGLRGIGSPRVELLERLNRASDVEGASINAIQEVQIRFLLAAAAAGVIELRMEEPDLREAMKAQQEEMRVSVRESALENAAYTYQAFSDAEVAAYAAALEDPRMQQVYTLMNAVQYELMANRFEAIAVRLAEMQPSQEL